MKNKVIVVVNNYNQFSAILANNEFTFSCRPDCLVAQGPWCSDRLRGLEDFTIIFGDSWAKNLTASECLHFCEVLATRRGVEKAYSRL